MATNQGPRKIVTKKTTIGDVFAKEPYIGTAVAARLPHVKAYEVIKVAEKKLEYMHRGVSCSVEGDRRQQWYKILLEEVRFSIKYDRQYVVSAPEVVCDILVEYYSGTEKSHVMETNYEQTDRHYTAISERLPILLDAIASFDPKLPVVIPGDGIGVGALASIYLKRRFYAAEPNEIGGMAEFAGILKRESFAEMVLAEEPVAWVYSNIQLYIEKTLVRQGDQAFILDARMNDYTDLGLTPVPGTNNRVWTNTPVHVVLKALRPPKSNYILESAKPLDPMAAEVCKMQSIPIADSGTPTVWSNRERVPPDAFVLRERKLASRPTGKPGQSRYTEKEIYPFNEHDYVMLTPDGVRVQSDLAYQRAGVLPGDYGPVEFITVTTPRHPTTYKMCVVNKKYYEVVVVEVLEILDKAYVATYQIVGLKRDGKVVSRKGNVEQSQFTTRFGVSGIG
jgi:hypothetical protein